MYSLFIKPTKKIVVMYKKNKKQKFPRETSIKKKEGK